MKKIYISLAIILFVSGEGIKANPLFDNNPFLKEIFTKAVQKSSENSDAYFSNNLLLLAPTTNAPTPFTPQNEVISMFSNAYTNFNVDTWSTGWDLADVEDTAITGNDIKKYTNLQYAGIDMGFNNYLNASTMNYFHVDMWTPNSTSFAIKLVDVGATGSTTDDSEFELYFTPTQNGWISYDIPMSDFTGLLARAHISLLILSGSNSTAYFDNVYFHKFPLSAGVSGAPTTNAATPSLPSSSVISMFSDAFTNVPVGTWSTTWDAADVADTAIAGNNIKKYFNFDYAAIEPGTSTIDASQKNFLHIDFWSKNSTQLGVTIVDYGANAVFGGGDDTQASVSIPSSNFVWIGYDIPLYNLTTLTARAHIGQIILSGGDGTKTVYVDNLYFNNYVPVAPANTPTVPAGQVISLFSNAAGYNPVQIDTWLTPWSQANVKDTTIAGNNVKKYTNMQLAAIDFGSRTIDAFLMDKFHIDFWTPNGTSLAIKLVDYGTNGVQGGGDDSESELYFTPTFGNWISYDIPLTDFIDLTAKKHISLIIISSSNSTGYVDNVYFKADLPLPIYFENFTAEKIGKIGKLKWANKDELKNKGFEIQRQDKYNNWRRIGYLPATANGTLTSNNSFVDNFPVIGKNDYRIIQTDTSGYIRTSPERQIDYNDLYENQVLYPNPAIDFIYLPLVNLVYTTKYDVVDMAGKTVLSSTLTALSTPFTRIDVSNLANGTYIIRYRSKGRNESFKFVKGNL